MPELIARRDSFEIIPGVMYWPSWWEYEHADMLVQDARWRLACASYQWIRGLEMLMGARDDAYRWLVVTGVARLRWIRRSSELMDYLPPSKELAVRRDG